MGVRHLHTQLEKDAMRSVPCSPHRKHLLHKQRQTMETLKSPRKKEQHMEKCDQLGENLQLLLYAKGQIPHMERVLANQQEETNTLPSKRGKKVLARRLPCWLEHRLIHQNGCGFDPHSGCIWEATNGCFSLMSLFLRFCLSLPPLSLSKIKKLIYG